MTAITLASAAALIAAAPMTARRIAVARLAARCSSRRALVLTYDDGPGATATPAILDLLAERGATATFFVLGQAVSDRPGIADRARREGHEIGSHTFRHLHPWRNAPWRSAEDVRLGLREAARWSGPVPLFRPAYGKITAATWAAARAAGAEIAWWTCDSGDTWAATPTADSVVARARAAGGGVVLMHDFERSAGRAAFVLDVTRGLLSMAATEGLRVLPYGRLAASAEHA